MLLIHHGCLSLPLIVFGLVFGLETPLGIAAFVLGAVPPAAGLPGFVASCGGLVRPIVRFCLLAYVVGVLLTPVLVVSAFDSAGPTGSIVTTLAFGLVTPAILGMSGRRWLVRLPRPFTFAVVATCVLVVALSLGPAFREAVEAGLRDPAFLVLAIAIGAGRCMWGVCWGVLLGPRGTRLEAGLVTGYKNAVLAAVIAYGIAGPLAALPCLIGILAEAGMLSIASLWSHRRRGEIATGPSATPQGHCPSTPE